MFKRYNVLIESDWNLKKGYEAHVLPRSSY